MAQASHPVIDFNEIATRYNEKDAEKGNPQKGTNLVNDAKLTMITLRAPKENVKWTTMSERSVNTPERSARRSEQRSKKDMKTTARVHIDQGLCKGLSTTLALPLPDNEDAAISIDPCKQDQTKESETAVELVSTPGPNTDGRVNTVHVGKEYYGTFECRVYPHGKLLLEKEKDGKATYGDVKTKVVLQYLKDQQDESSVDAFEEDNEGEFFFIMRGELQLSQDVQMQHNWQ